MLRNTVLLLIAVTVICIPLNADNTNPGADPSASIEPAAAAAFQAPSIEQNQQQTMMQTQLSGQDIASTDPANANIATQEGENLILQQKMDEDIKDGKLETKASRQKKRQSEKNRKLLKQIKKHLNSKTQKPGNKQNTDSSESSAEAN